MPLCSVFCPGHVSIVVDFYCWTSRCILKNFLSLQMVRNRISPVQAEEDLDRTFMKNISESHFHISCVWGNTLVLHVLTN